MSYGFSRSYEEDRPYNPLKKLYKGLLRYFRAHPESEEEIPWNSPLPVYPPRWLGTKATSTPIRERRPRPKPVPRALYKESFRRMPTRKNFTPCCTGRSIPDSILRDRPPIRVVRTPRTPVYYRRRPITDDSYAYYGRPVAVSTPSRNSYYLPRKPVFVEAVSSYNDDYPSYTKMHPLNQELYKVDYMTSTSDTDYLSTNL